MACRFKIELQNGKFCELSDINPGKTTVGKLKELISDKEGINVDQFSLIYGGAQLNENKLLSEYDIGGTRNAIIMTASFRWSGGSSSTHIPDITHPKICYKKGDDCLHGGEEDEKTIEIKLCGCIYAPSSLHSWADNELRSKAEFKQFECPNCKSIKKKQVILSFDLVACACGWNEEEYNRYYQLFKRKQLNPKEFQNCPFCYCIVQRKIDDNNKINRSRCGNAKCVSEQDWCWKCHEPWKTNNMTVCGNQSCTKTIAEKNLTLKDCPTKRFQWSSIDCTVPIFRACINNDCNQIYAHDKDCNHMTCPSCKTEFCFICLQKWPCQKKYDQHKDGDIAPRQALKEQK